jgi:hypothetical protein
MLEALAHRGARRSYPRPPLLEPLQPVSVAMTIVRAEEVAKGRTPGASFSKSREREDGCDFLSSPPGGGEPHPVEVKASGRLSPPRRRCLCGPAHDGGNRAPSHAPVVG